MLSTASQPASTKPNVKITGNKGNINDFIWQETKGIVQSGPFQGMQLSKEAAWEDDNLGTKCLGCYEMELHDLIEAEIKNLLALENPVIVDIGCAEGYYAVGLSMRVPKATVYIVDIDEKSLQLCCQAAIRNKATVVPGVDLSISMQAPNLVIVDCEGAEVEYLNRERFPALDRAHIVVECHDFPQQRTTEILAQRFDATHNIMYCTSETVRMPNNFEFLCGLPSHAKWLAVSEGRPSTQYFLYMIPK